MDTGFLGESSMNFNWSWNMLHKQVICTTKAGEKIEVDEKIAPFVQKLWDNEVDRKLSCLSLLC